MCKGTTTRRRGESARQHAYKSSLFDAQRFAETVATLGTLRIMTKLKLQKAKEELKKPKTVRLIDRVAFCLGVLGIILTQYIVMLVPHRFLEYYCVVIPTLVAFRYKMYYDVKMHYFLLDFCYFANGLLVLHLALERYLGVHTDASEMPLLTSPLHCLFKVSFLFANGPLAMAIVAWRNSLVFHSLDRVTSVYIHAFPMCLTFCERWFTNRTVDDCVSMRDFFISILIYSFWQTSYLLETEVRKKKFFDADAELTSSLRWLAQRGDGIPVVQVVRKVCEKVGFMKKGEKLDPTTMKTKAVMVVGQLVFTLATMLPAVLCYDYYYFHVLVTWIVIMMSVWNGATYYFEVFARRYPHAKTPAAPATVSPPAPVSETATAA